MIQDYDYLLISGIQHYYFCQRQWGLIHVEAQWESNIHTIRGDIVHEKVDDPFLMEKRGDLIISRSVPVVSHQYGCFGVVDLIEYTKSDIGVTIPNRMGLFQIHPVEYKKGKPKENECDSVQLCLQAICLEEMYGIQVPIGSIYYAKTKKRVSIEFSESLRLSTTRVLERMHFLLEKGFTPMEEYSSKCDHCSLYNRCLPKTISKKKQSVKKYILSRLSEESGCK